MDRLRRPYDYNDLILRNGDAANFEESDMVWRPQNAAASAAWGRPVLPRGQLDINEIRKQAALRGARQRYPGLDLGQVPMQSDPLAGIPDAVRNFNPDPPVEPSKSATEVMRMLQSMGKVPEPMGASIGGNQPPPAQERPGMGVPMAPVDPQLPAMSDAGQIYADLSRITKPLDEGMRPTSAQEAWQALYDRDSARASGMRSISEGLGNIRAITAGDVLHKTHAAEPFIAEDLRARQGEIENRMSPDEAAALGLEYRPGMTKAMAQPLMAQRQQHDRFAQQEKLQGAQFAHQQTMNDADNAAALEMAALRAGTQQHQQRLVDTKTVEKIRGLDEMIQLANEIEAEKDNRWTGPIDSRVSGALETMDMNPGGAGFRQKVHGLFYQKMVANAGLSQTASEVKNNALLMPQVTDNDAVFKTKLKNIREMLTRERDSTIAAQGASGRDVSGFSGMTSSGTTQTTPATGRFTIVLNPDTGEEVEIDEADVEEAQRRGWRRAGM